MGMLSPMQKLEKVVKKKTNITVTSDSSGICYFPFSDGVIINCSVAISSSFHPVLLYSNTANSRMRAGYYIDTIHGGAITKFSANTSYSFEAIYIPYEYYSAS